MESITKPTHQESPWLLALAALGVVYGDIGTSPLYALRECFAPHYGIEPHAANILGVLSLIFWSLTLVVSVKYVGFLLHAHNRGEGGILALLALVSRKFEKPNSRSIAALTVFGVFGASLLYGDGIITPVITILGAVEGLKTVAPSFEPLVLPISVAILIGLFTFQKSGTAKIGLVFGPIILTWFFVIGGIGIVSILQYPAVLEALNPHYGVNFLFENGKLGFFVLGSVFLVVTGGEALYADMGHFGKTPIQLAWFSIAFPGLVLNYFGQGAFLLSHPGSVDNPFFQMAPDWSRFSLVILSTMAGVIASQALISGVFSLTRQAVQLGYCPRLTIVHTSHREIGQIYIPFLNWCMLIGTVWLALSFKSSSALASAYGIAVTGTMIVTSVLAYFVAKRVFGWPVWLAATFIGFFLFIELSFFFANVVKLAEGGWFPLVVGLLIYTLMSTWSAGRQLLLRRLKEKAVPLSDFLKEIETRKPAYVPGSAVFMTGDPHGTPPTLVHNLKHNKVLHEFVAILTYVNHEVPYILSNERVEVQDLGKGLIRVVIHVGFMETPRMAPCMKTLENLGYPLSMKDAIFFLGRDTIVASSQRPGMAIWREKLFAFMAANALRATAFFDIPPEQVIEVGIQVDV